jgi:uncharacterized protein (TIGR03067 family)
MGRQYNGRPPGGNGSLLSGETEAVGNSLANGRMQIGDKLEEFFLTTNQSNEHTGVSHLISRRSLMRQSAFFVVSFCVMASAGAGDGSTLLEQEKARFKGTWQIVSAEYDGTKAQEDQIKHGRATIGSGTYSVRFGEKVVAEGVSFEIDPSRSPKHVTDTVPSGPDRGKVILGIYRLEGDTLTTCVAPFGHDRPVRFAAASGSGHTLRVFRRVKTEDSKTPAQP